jgi:hypothetical protein
MNKTKTNFDFIKIEPFADFLSSFILKQQPEPQKIMNTISKIEMIISINFMAFKSFATKKYNK